MYLLLAIPSIAFAQVDTRIIETEQSRGNPPTEKVVRPEPPVRQEMPQPPRDINRQFPLPMNQYWNSQRPSPSDCFNMPPQFLTVCVDMGTSRNRSMNRRPTNKPLRQQIRQATPRQRREIQQARKEFQQKVRRILKK